jgi:hypothetical protein
MHGADADAPAPLRVRFEAAKGRRPLSDLSPVAARELTRLLDELADFDDLPGGWQAALLRAEAACSDGPSAAPSCCSSSATGGSATSAHRHASATPEPAGSRGG